MHKGSYSNLIVTLEFNQKRGMGVQARNFPVFNVTVALKILLIVKAPCTNYLLLRRKTFHPKTP